jgi:hypothetical protein
MAFFGLFGDKKKDELKQFEKMFKRVWAKKSTQRQADRRDAFLTPDLLRRRREVTQSGKQKLVLDLGSQGGKVSYTLADLNKMAKAMEKAEGKFVESTRGVSAEDLIRSSRKIDIERAKKITNSTLYKFDGSIMLFRATSQNDNGYHQVKIRIEDWEHEVRAGKGDTYLPAAASAARGRISFDCDCGRHQYWYRYLATIGGFALDPKEFAFPKIRNPKLQGCCCKHVIKTLAVMQTSFVQSRIALEMKAQAQKKGWFSRLLHGERPTETFMEGKDLQASELSGNVDIMKAFKDMKKAQQGIGQKILSLLTGRTKKTEKKMDSMLGKGTVSETLLKHEIKKNKQLEKESAAKDRDILIGKLDAHILRAVQIGKKPKDEAIKSFADANKMTVKEVEKLGKEANIL